MLTRTSVLNQLAAAFQYRSYLEIGLDQGVNFLQVEIEEKVGVDPSDAGFTPTHLATSDEFFLLSEQTFDLIFIDGLHEEEHVRRDILNSLDVLNPGGTIVCHDINPMNEVWQRVPRETIVWSGDCWKAWVRLRAERADLEMVLLDCDCGVGIIRRGSQDLIDAPSELNWDGLVENRAHWLNLVPETELPRLIEDWQKA